jgi:hypothetical protein
MMTMTKTITKTIKTMKMMILTMTKKMMMVMTLRWHHSEKPWQSMQAAAWQAGG